MPRLVIDGYNYIYRIMGHSSKGLLDLDAARRAFLDRLSRYKRVRQIDITVVFDAYKGYSPNRQRENYKGIEIVYTRANETADELIIEWVRKKRAGLIVVSSDRVIIDEAKANHVPFITTVRLEESIRDGIYDGIEEKEGLDGDYEEGHRGKKRGNPKRPPKRLRKAFGTVKRLEDWRGKG